MEQPTEQINIALSDNIKNNQPTINIGMIGSVSNGKSLITEKITGIKTQKHSKEKERNITIKLGYANAKIFKCLNCPSPQCYQPHSSSIMTTNCKFCDCDLLLIKHISLLDSPGHNLLMLTMLNGTCVMHNTILVESASNKTLASQTKEHLKAIGMVGLRNSITCLNKMDLIKKDFAFDKINSLNNSLIGTLAENCPIIPIAANYGINIDVLCEYICKYIPEPIVDLNGKLKMIIIRSFNINKQDISYENIQGGVIGGTIMKGIVNVNDKVCIYPGIITKNESSSKECWSYKPLFCSVISINSETNVLQYAIPGGLLGIKLDIDPGLTIKDGLVGNILTTSDNINEYKIFETIIVILELLDSSNNTQNEFDKFKPKDIFTINFNACNSKCEIIKIKNNKAELKLLEKPICAKFNDYITLSITSLNNTIVVGRAKILKGKESLKK